MNQVWSVDNKDYATPQEAIDVVESKGSGTVILFNLQRNREGCLPEFEHKSSAMWSFQGGEWWSHYIYNGTGEKLAKEKPH